MAKSRTEKGITAAMLVIGTLCALVSAYYARATYIKQFPAPRAPTDTTTALQTVQHLMPPWWVFALLGMAVLLLITAWFWKRDTPQPVAENRRSATETPQAKPSMSVQERHDIQEIRTLWKLYFSKAAQHCHLFIQTVVAVREGETYWIELVNPVRWRLSTAMEALATAVADESVESLRHVQTCHDALFDVYNEAYEWIALIADHEKIDLAQTPTTYDLERWRSEHKAFQLELLKLVQAPVHRGLKSTSRYLKPEVVRLLYPEEAHRLPTENLPFPVNAGMRRYYGVGARTFEHDSKTYRLHNGFVDLPAELWARAESSGLSQTPPPSR